MRNTATTENRESPFRALLRALLRALFQRAAEVTADLRASSPILFKWGVAYALLGLVFLVVIPLDPRLVLGINPWIKPLKFATSIAIYLFTIAWYMQHLELKERTRAILCNVIVASMLVEMLLITFQAGRGVPSHFNNTSVLNASIYGIMGLGIVANTVAASVVAVSFFQVARIARWLYSEPLLLWSLRLGVLVFLIGSCQGGYMAHQPGHAVGASDGGPGLPLLNWSVTAGDLRVAHFVGLHALQVIPLFGFAVHALGARRAWPVVLFSLAYLGAFSLVFVQALLGQPLL